MTIQNDSWPVSSGDYVLGDRGSPVAIVIIGRGAVDLPLNLFNIKGILKTENIGLEKVIANIVSNPTIRVLVVCGKEEFGHFPGDAIQALKRNGVDEHQRILGTRSAIPFLCDLPAEAIERFREQVEVIDLLDTSHVQELVAYDPLYEFDRVSREKLMGVLKELSSRHWPPFPAEPVVVRTRSLTGEGTRIAKELHVASDEFISPMLRLPSDGLNTGMGLILISEEHGTILEPLQGLVLSVPSVELALRMRSYLMGV